MKSKHISSFIIFILIQSHLIIAQDLIITWGDDWQYYDAGDEPAAQSGNMEWHSFEFDDSAWQNGPSHFGYGDGDEATVTQPTLAQYFRKEFHLANGAAYVDIDVNLVHDDGINIYLNGTNLTRVNMPTGNIDYNTLALYYVENEITTASFPIQLLNGKNVIAVEVHQATLNSSDISFNLQLRANKEDYIAVKRGPYLQKGASNTVTIKWRTSRATQSVINYGTNLNVLSQSKSELSLKKDHEITLNNLQANTKYYYEISNSDFIIEPKTEDLYFKTAPIVGERQAVTAWILGDCGIINSNQRAVRNAYYNYIGNEHTDLLLFLGDNAYNDGTDGDYQYAVFQNMYEDKLKNTISWSTRGNHERYDPITQSVAYYDIFSFPTNAECGGLASGTEAYYSFDYANIHFIVLDSYDSNKDVGESMYNWCKADVQNTTAEWLVALWHHPPYTKGSHNSDVETYLIEMRQNFLPMLEDNGVDLVLSGHSHSYERSYFLNGHYGSSDSFDINENTVGENGNGSGKLSSNQPYEKHTIGHRAGEGTVYITAGSSGKTSYGPLNHKAMYYSVRELGSCVLEVNQDTMNVKFLRETGLVEDYFTIIKAACIDELSIDDVIPTNTYQANSQIFSTGEVLSQDSVFFKAKDVIRLETNFSVKNGARFSARNEECE